MSDNKQNTSQSASTLEANEPRYENAADWFPPFRVRRDDDEDFELIEKSMQAQNSVQRMEELLQLNNLDDDTHEVLSLCISSSVLLTNYEEDDVADHVEIVLNTLYVLFNLHPYFQKFLADPDSQRRVRTLLSQPIGGLHYDENGKRIYVRAVSEAD